MISNVYKNFELTKDNHIQYYFNNDETNHWRESQFDVTHMKFGSEKYNDMDFVDSLIDTSKNLLSKHKNDEFLLFLSGGLDSEVACRSFVLTGMKFKPLIVKFSNNLNSFDIENAINLCSDLKLEPVIFNFDPILFFKSEDWKRICIEYQSYTFYQQILLSIAEKISSPLLTVDEIELVKQNDNSWAFIKKEDQDGCWHRFVEKKNIPAYNNFYTYDVSTMEAFLKNATVKALVDNRIFGKLSWTSSKNKIYSELTKWEMTPRIKRTGMEKMMNIWSYVEEECLKILPGVPQIYNFDLPIKGPMICNIT